MTPRFFSLDFGDFSVVVKTLTRGEIFACYLAQGFPEREIPAGRGHYHDQARLETALCRVACVERPDEYEWTEDLPAGVVTQIAHWTLAESGFLEKTPQQDALVAQAAVYSRSSEALGDSLIMHTFPRYGLDELHALDPGEWTRLVFLAVGVQEGIYGVKARQFLVGDSGTPDMPGAPPRPQAQPDGMAPEFVQKIFGLSAERRAGFEKVPVVAGGGSLSLAGGHQTWGDTRAAP